MKKMYFLLATLFTLNYALAQENTPTDKGVVFLRAGSNLAIEFFKDDESYSDFKFDLAGGYFVAKNFLIGAGVEIHSTNTAERIIADEVQEELLPELKSLTDFNFFIRYYPVGKVILEGGILSKEKLIFVDPLSQKYESDRESKLFLEAGYAFFVNDYFSVEPTVRYKNFSGNEFSMHVRLGIYW